MHKYLSASFRAIVIATLTALFAACSGNGQAASNDNEVNTIISRAEWNAKGFKETLPLGIYQARVYEPHRLGEFENQQLLIAGVLDRVTDNKDGSTTFYISDLSSSARSDYKNGVVGVLYLAEQKAYARSKMVPLGSFVRLECAGGKFIGELTFACLGLEIT